MNIIQDNKAKEGGIDLTLYVLIPTKPLHQIEVEIYQSQPQAQTVPSQFLVPQLFQVFDIFLRQAFVLQVVQSSHIYG